MSDSQWSLPEQPVIEMKDDDIELKKSVQSHSVMLKGEDGMTELLFSKFSVKDPGRRSSSYNHHR